MTVNSYLTNLASNAIIRDAEKQGIQRSISTLESRLRTEFFGQLSEQFIFGSYSRGTILPRYMDERSDVDYMVVFREGGLRPQTYLSRLRRFAERNYSRSEIFQSNPTVVLSLNHIRFELVPGLSGLLWGYQIPAKASDYEDWINTNPTSFNQTIVNANQANNNLIKPAVRLAKYWNASNGYVFDSYELEKKIAEGSYWNVGSLFGGGPRLQDVFYAIVENFDTFWFGPAWKREKVERAKQVVSQVKLHQASGQEIHAEGVIKRILPEPSALGALLGGLR